MSILDDGVIINPDIDIPGVDVGGEVIEALVYNPNQCINFNLIKLFYLPDALLYTGGMGPWLDCQLTTPSEDQLLLGRWVTGNLFSVNSVSLGTGRFTDSNTDLSKVSTFSEINIATVFAKIAFSFSNTLIDIPSISGFSVEVTLNDGSIVHEIPLYTSISKGVYKLDFNSIVKLILSRGTSRQLKAWNDIVSIKCTTNLISSPRVSGGSLVSIGTYSSNTRLPVNSSESVFRGNSSEPFTLNTMYLD